MIVCSCFGVSDHTLRRLVANGVSTLDEIVSACGAGTGCGACASMVSDVIGSEADVRCGEALASLA